MSNYRQKTKQAYDKIVETYINKNDGQDKSLLKVRLQKIYKLQGWKDLKEKKVLELGFGTGRDLELLVANKLSPDSYLGIDISDSMTEHCSKRFPKYNLVAGDILTYKYPKGEYDLIWASAILLHLNSGDLKKMLKKMHEALSKDGIVMISMRIKQGRDDKEAGLVRSGKEGERFFAYYTPEEFKAILEKNGFKVLGIERKFEPDGETEWMFVYGGRV